jgi:hypothetical protein
MNTFPITYRSKFFNINRQLLKYTTQNYEFDEGIWFHRARNLGMIFRDHVFTFTKLYCGT